MVLTIDDELNITEEAMLGAVERTGAESAYAVVMEVATGEILAMVSLPSQTPTMAPPSRWTCSRTTRRWMPSSRVPSSSYRRGSGLEESSTPSSSIDCEGGAWRVSNKTIHDDHPHGVVTLTEVIKYSSNIGSAKLAFKLGPERTLAYLKDFGFSRSTRTCRARPAASCGRPTISSPSSWPPPHTDTASPPPQCSWRALWPHSQTTVCGWNPTWFAPSKTATATSSKPTSREDRRVVSVETAQQTVRMMETVTKGGTGTCARIDGYRVAGKTGTA